MVTVESLTLGSELIMVGGIPALKAPGLTELTRLPGAKPLTRFALVPQIIIQPSDMDRDHMLAFDVVTMDGKSLLPPTQPQVFGVNSKQVDFPNDEVAYAPYAHLEVRFPKPDLYYVIARINGKEAKRVKLRIREGVLVKKPTT